MKSMTGYAARDAEGRRWDIRSVNARGLDIRLRLPDRPAGLEPLVRKRIAAVAARGNISVSLRLDGPDGQGVGAADLDALLDAVAAVEARAAERGLTLRPPSAAEVLSLSSLTTPADDGPSLAACQADLDDLLTAFDADRLREGAGLRAVIAEQVDEIERLTQAAQALSPARAEHIAASHRAAFARLSEATGEDRAPIAAEIAALLVKGDVTEELDRLGVHIAAARTILSGEGPCGRRLDFLTQEFNREANTLCSKSQMAELTRIGLDLKTVIDRLREQVQNLE